MPNYTTGQDLTPVTWDISTNETTYNGLIRVNSGIVDQDGTGDPLRVFAHKFLANLDQTLTFDNTSATPVPGAVVVYDGSGNITANQIIGTTASGDLSDLGITSGIIDGGSY